MPISTDTETLDRLYLEWSQFTKTETRREIELAGEIARLRHALRTILKKEGDPYEIAQRALTKKGVI